MQTCVTRLTHCCLQGLWTPQNCALHTPPHGDGNPSHCRSLVCDRHTALHISVQRILSEQHTALHEWHVTAAMGNDQRQQAALHMHLLAKVVSIPHCAARPKMGSQDIALHSCTALLPMFSIVLILSVYMEHWVYRQAGVELCQPCSFSRITSACGCWNYSKRMSGGW